MSEVTSENIRGKEVVTDYETHKPIKLEAVEREVLNELLDE